MIESVAQAVESFDAAWRSTPFPDLEKFLPGETDPQTRVRYLASLIGVDLEYRWRTDVTDWSSRSKATSRTTSGLPPVEMPHRPLLEDYIDRIPELRDQTSILVDLIAAEYRIRVRWGDRPDHDDYYRRFRLPRDRMDAALRDVDVALSAEWSAATIPRDQPRVFGEYVVIRELGRGGMGVVYEARHQTREHRVALKTIRMLDVDLALRLKHEFRSLAELSHPNLVKFETLYAEGERPFVTMELVDAMPFVKYVRGHCDAATTAEREAPGFDLQRLVESLRQLVEAIEYLHNANRLHRDIKPTNVLVTGEGRVVVLDFGLAVELRENEYRNSQALPAGTLAYMSPEQQLGKPLSPASDWYSVGIILYESLAGHLPFGATGFAELMQSKLESPPPLPDSVIESVPAELEELCRQLLSPDPGQRPAGSAIALQVGAVASVKRASSNLLVGRRDSLDELARYWAKVRWGSSMTVFLVGQSGVGKTSLVERFLELNCRHSGTVILRGKCYENEEVPYKGFDAVVDSLVAYLTRLPGAGVERVMPLDVGSLCRVFPAFTQVDVFRQAQASGSSVDALELRHRGFESLKQLLCRLARFNELVLFIDDLQWGGNDAAELFIHLFQGSDAPACLTICALREEDPGSEFVRCVNHALDSSTSGVTWQRMRLRRLGPEAATEMAFVALGDQGDIDLAQSIASQSDGLPFLIHLLAEDIVVTGRRDRSRHRAAPELETAILTLTESLADQPRRLIEVLSVAGCPLQLSVVAKAAECGNEFDAFRELRSLRLIRTTDVSAKHVDLYHDKIRETLQAHLTAEQLSAHSMRLGAVLESSGTDAALLGRLFAQAGDSTKAGSFYVQAARQAKDALAFHRAVELYGLALNLLQPVGDRETELRRALGDSLRLSGSAAAAAEQYLLAAEVSVDPLRLDLFCQGAGCLLASGHVEPGLETLKRVLSECGIAFPHSSATAIVSLLRHRLLLRLRGYDCHPRARESVSRDQSRRLQAYWAAVAGLSMIDPLRAGVFAGRNLRESLRMGDATHLIRALTCYAGHIAAGGYKVRQHVERLLAKIDELASADGGPYAIAAAAIGRGSAMHLQSRYRESVELCDRAVAHLLDERSRTADERCCDVAWELNIARSMGMWSLMYMGRIDELARRQPELSRTAEETNDLFAALNFGTQITTHVLLGADRPDEARRRLQADAERLSSRGFFVQHQNHLLATAFLEQYCGCGERAWKHLESGGVRYSKSVLSHVQHMRIDFLQAKGRAALAAAIDSRDSQPLLRAALVTAKQLKRQRTPWARAHARLLCAALAVYRRDAGAATQFADAACAFEDLDGHLFAAAARLRVAQMTGTGYDDAVARVERLGVRNAERMSAALIPAPP